MPNKYAKVQQVCLGCQKPFMAVAAEIRRGWGMCCSRSCATKATHVAPEATVREKYRAKRIVSELVKAGKLIRPTSCPKCGCTNRRIEGHHTDYSKPDQVEWVCASCHMYLHRKVLQTSTTTDHPA